MQIKGNEYVIIALNLDQHGKRQIRSHRANKLNGADLNDAKRLINIDLSNLTSKVAPNSNY